MKAQWLRVIQASSVRGVVTMLLLAVAFILVPSSYAQGTAPPATNIQVGDGSNPGQVIITWDAVPEATYYRIGYVNMDSDYKDAKAVGDWKEAFLYVDVANRGQRSYTIKRLEQGANHAFTVLTNGSRYSQPTWPSNPAWRYLIVQNRGCDCEVAEGQQSGTPDSNIGMQNINLRSVSVGISDDHICGIRMDFSAICWGQNNRGQSLPPLESFLSISTGNNHTCGVRIDNIVACWGRNSANKATPPSGSFISVSAGYAHNCGILSDDTVTCWGSNQIWGDTHTGQSDAPSDNFKLVSAGWFHNCGIRIDDTVVCWGLNTGAWDSNLTGQANPPAGDFAKVSAGLHHTCGVRTDGTGSCWGSTSHGAEVVPEGQFKDVSAGADSTCWIKNDSTLTCRGSLEDARLESMAGYIFKSVSIGDQNICALTEDNVLICRSASRNYTDPSGVLAAIARGGNHSCAIRDDKTLSCWGQNGYGQAVAPAGLFRSVELGEQHSCGLQTDGMVVCWGKNDAGQASPPQDAFKMISAGHRHSCGIKSDNSAVCWGSNKAQKMTCEGTSDNYSCDIDNDESLVGQSNAPEGEFKGISAGGFHTCGVKIDGQLVCWGSNHDLHEDLN